MDLSLTRYKLEDVEVEPLVDFLRSKNFVVEWSESDKHFFIYQSFPDGKTEFVHGHGYIYMKRESEKQEERSNRLEVVYGGDLLAKIAYEYYTDKNKRHLQELVDRICCIPASFDEVTIF